MDISSKESAESSKKMNQKLISFELAGYRGTWPIKFIGGRLIRDV
jgi:hypothetical protein